MSIARTVVTAALANLKTAADDPANEQVNDGYVQGLVRVQPDGSNRGSYIEGIDSLTATEQLLTEQLDWTEMNPSDLPKGAAIPIARYFRANVPKSMVGRTGILTYGSLSDEQRQQVQFVQGSHGMELVMSWNGDLAETDEVWTIVGKDGDMMWTWYPGPLTPRLNDDQHDNVRMVLAGEEVDEQTREMVNSLAVKLKTD